MSVLLSELHLCCCSQAASYEDDKEGHEEMIVAWRAHHLLEALWGYCNEYEGYKAMAQLLRGMLHPDLNFRWTAQQALDYLS